METTISSSLNCFLQDISVPCLVQWRPNSAWRFLARNDSQDSASLKMPGLFLIQLLLLVKLSFTFVKSRNFFKGFHYLFFVGERNDSFQTQPNRFSLHDSFLCVFFLSLENTGGASFVDVERDGQSVISICWGQSGRILVLSIAGIFRSSYKSI